MRRTIDGRCLVSVLSQCAMEADPGGPSGGASEAVLGADAIAAGFAAGWGRLAAIMKHGQQETNDRHIRSGTWP